MSALPGTADSSSDPTLPAPLTSIVVGDSVIKWSNPQNINVEDVDITNSQPGASVDPAPTGTSAAAPVAKTEEIEAKQNETEMKTQVHDLSGQRKTFETWEFKSSFVDDASEMIGDVANGGGKAMSVVYKAGSIAAHAELAMLTGGITLIALPIDYYLSGFIGKLVGKVGGSVVGAGAYGVKLASMGVYNGVQSVRQHNYDTNKQRYEELSKIYHQLDDYKNFCNSLNVLNRQLHDLKQSEQQFFKKKFFINDAFGKSKRVMLIGPTRFGKSALSNKLLGRKETPFKLSKLPDDKVYFQVGKSGANSTTKHLKIVPKVVEISEYVPNDDLLGDDGPSHNLKYWDSFNLNVIDTPGAFDINGKTDAYMNEMLEFGKQFGGIHMFIIVFKFNGAFEANYKSLLENYQTFWGRGWWKHCIIAITQCDKDSEERAEEVEEGFAKSVDTIKNGLNKVNDKISWDKIPILQFGKQNFNDSIKELFYLLSNNENNFYGPYKCKKIRFPIDDAWDNFLSDGNKLRNWEYYNELMSLQQWLLSVHNQN